MFARGFVRNELYNIRIDFEELQIDGRNTILSAQKVCNFLVSQQSHLDEHRPESAARFFLLSERLCQLVMINDLFPHQQIAQSLRHTFASPVTGSTPVSAFPKLNGPRDSNCTVSADRLHALTRRTPYRWLN